MPLIGCWRYTGTPTQNGVDTVGNNETTPLRPDSLLGEFKKASESRISETTLRACVFFFRLTVRLYKLSMLSYVRSTQEAVSRNTQEAVSRNTQEAVSSGKQNGKQQHKVLLHVDSRDDDDVGKLVRLR
ncbi:hypothetical protein LSAT2_001545 [Lamellibrachia satsuma]|nr:hypothetical protein LSAT2_001545 [Lamellibrachia satsuma]